MTKTEILSELTQLLDFVNDTGKAKLRRLEAHVRATMPDDERSERRTEERDPFETEQRQAEELGLTEEETETRRKTKKPRGK
jgi:hypothetical protein